MGKRYVTIAKVKTHNPIRVSDHSNSARPKGEGPFTPRISEDGVCLLRSGSFKLAILPESSVLSSRIVTSCDEAILLLPRKASSRTQARTARSYPRSAEAAKGR